MYRTLLLLQQQAILISYRVKKLFFNIGFLVPFSVAWFLPIKTERGISLAAYKIVIQKTTLSVFIWI